MWNFKFVVWWAVLINGIILGQTVVPNTTEPAKTCRTDEFKCPAGNCIPMRFVCDQENDCGDGYDESTSVCSLSRLFTNVFMCKIDGGFIPVSWVCDGMADCLDGSDEINCETKSCSVEEFSCKTGDGECIPLAWVCDESKDCSDGSDEASCNDTCRSDEFACSNGRCIQKRWMCDLDDDCGDASDEKNCETPTCNKTKEFKCANGGCISKKWHCDGDPDCLDASDELNCPKNVTRALGACVAAKEFQCNDKVTCIHETWVCDGDADCPGGEDEMPPHCKNVTCRGDQFQCKDNTCIPGFMFCDGKWDCMDKSDEIGCSLAKTTACNQTTEFDCGGGVCIPWSKVCDKHPDCPNMEDEPMDKCHKNECDTNNGGCTQRCVDLPIGSRCECHSGYKLMDNKTCVDINECEIPGACSQICINEVGTFKCECEPGYMRDPRNHTRCKATEGHASLLFARRNDIRKIALDHPEITSIVNDTKSATALDYVFRTGMIFWSDVSTQRIYKAPIDEGSDKTVVLRNHSVTSDGLAVDWIYNHVYFTDTQKCTIELTNFDGNMGKVLIEDNLEIPRSIAVDPVEGWMYWSDWGATPKIERAGMDGTHRQTIVTYDVKWPNGLTLDLVLKRVYWVDAKLNTISSCNYDGSQRRLVLYSIDALRHPFSITTFEDYVYWTDWDKQTVYKANKFNGEDLEPVTALHMLQHPMTIHVYHPYRQPDSANFCQSVNGHCSHLCLPAPQISERSPRITCACPTGLKLMSDGLMCVEDATTTTVSPSRKPSSSGHNSSSMFSEKDRILHDGDNKKTNQSFDNTSSQQSYYSLYGGIFLFEMCFNRQLIQPTPSKNISASHKVYDKPISQIGTNYNNQMGISNESLAWVGLSLPSPSSPQRKSSLSSSSSSLTSSSLSASSHETSLSASISTSLLQGSSNTHITENLNTTPTSAPYWGHKNYFNPVKQLALQLSNNSSRKHSSMFDDNGPPQYIQWLCQKFGSDGARNGSNMSHPDGTIVHPAKVNNESAILMISFGIGGVVVLVIVLYFTYRHCNRRNLTSINFDNPVYRKTTEDQFSLEKNKTSYPSTVDEETLEPLNTSGTECV